MPELNWTHNAALHDRVVAAVTAAIEQSETRSVPLKKIPDIAGIDKETYGRKLSAWLKAFFPEFDLPDGQPQGNEAVRLAEPLPEQDQEIRQMHVLAAMNYWNANQAKLRRYRLPRGIDAEALRRCVAESLARTLLGGGPGFADGLDETPPRFAFPSGLVTAENETIYCVLGVNPRPGQAQFWRLLDFAVPGEADAQGLGAWLLSHAGSVSCQPDLHRLTELADAVEQRRLTLLEGLERFAESLRKGVEPEGDFAAQAADYAQRWQALLRGAAETPDFPASRPLALGDFAFLREEQDAPAALRNAAARFCAVCGELGRAEAVRAIVGDAPAADAARFAAEPDLAALETAVSAYQALLRIMSAAEPETVTAEIDEAARYFQIHSYKAAMACGRLGGKAAPLATTLGEIRASLRQSALRAAEPEPAPEPTDPDALLRRTLAGDETLPAAWIRAARGLCPAREELRRAVADTPGERTPYAIGTRLLETFGNEARCAEGYLILGLYPDAVRCAPALLNLYRAARRGEDFDAVWSRYFAGQNAMEPGEENVLFAFERLCEKLRGRRLGWDELEAFLRQYPGLAHNPAVKQTLLTLSQSGADRPRAFWAWLDVTGQAQNALETALENNDGLRARALAEDRGGLLALGYSEAEAETIRSRLERDLVPGMDNYAKARRIFAVQGNLHGAAERFLWRASRRPEAARDLFELYFAEGDMPSAAWILRSLRPDIRERSDLIRKAARCLVSVGDEGELAPLAKAHPEIWDLDGVLPLLAERAEPEGLYDWQAILRENGEALPAPEPEAGQPREAYLRGRFQALAEARRWRAVAAFCAAYPDLLREDDGRLAYWRSLLALGEHGPLLADVERHPRAIQKAPALAEEIYRVAAARGRRSFVEEIRRRVSLMPGNQFEKYVIDPDLSGLQQMLGDPRQLLELGYSQEAVDHFSDRFGKPFATGKTPFAVASRVLHFFGSERAEAFFRAAEDEPKAARLPFSFYYGAARWDDLCDLYFRRRENPEVWTKESYTTGCEKALRLATQRRNCERLLLALEKMDLASEDERLGLTLKACAGVGDRERVRVAQRALLRRAAEGCPAETAFPYFDQVWAGGDDGEKREAVDFAAAWLRAAPDALPAEDQKRLASANGHLLSEDAAAWADALRTRGETELLDILCCGYGFSISDSPALAAEYAEDLIARLEEEPVSDERLALYARLPEAAPLEPQLGDRLADLLLERWMRSAAGRLPKTGWTALFKLLGERTLSPEQSGEIWEIWRASFAGSTMPAERKQAMRVGARLCRALPADEEIRRELAEAWLSLLEQDPAEIDADAWAALGAFARDGGFRDAQRRLLSVMGAQSAELLRAYPGCLARVADLLLDESLDAARRDACTELFFRALLQKLSRDGLSSEDDLESFARFVTEAPLSEQQARQLWELLFADRVFAENALSRALYRKSAERWPNLRYQMLRQAWLSAEEDSPAAEGLHRELLDAAETVFPGQKRPDEADLQALTQAVSVEATAERLTFLADVFAQAERPEETDILRLLARQAAEGEAAGGALEAWLWQTLERRDPDWISRYARWWGPLVRLSPEDLQAKEVLPYLGFGEEEAVLPAVRFSVLRLAMQDLLNPVCLQCLIRICPNLTPGAKAKLEYFSAMADPRGLEAAAEACVQGGEYTLAVRLLVRLMGQNNEKTSPIGRLLGRIYQERVLSDHPELADDVEDVFRGIQKMNESDELGTWQNLGRAVEIAILTRQEETYFRVLGQDTLLKAAGKYLVVAANLLLRGAYETAHRQLENTQDLASSPHFEAVRRVAEECARTNTLSRKNELFLRSIAREGNNSINMEQYARLIDYAAVREQESGDESWMGGCAEAFEMNLLVHGADRLAYRACMQFMGYAPQDPERIAKAFRYGRAYLERVAAGHVFDAAQSLCVLNALLPGPGENVIQICKTPALGLTAGQLGALVTLLGQCGAYRNDCGDLELAERILFQAGTGTWRFSRAMLGCLPGENLLQKLARLAPKAFAGACFVFALRSGDAADSELARRTLTLAGLERAASQIPVLTALRGEAPETAAALAALLDRPLDFPELYRVTLERLLAETPEARLEAVLRLFFSLEPDMTVVDYRSNWLRLQDTVSRCLPQSGTRVLRLLIDLWGFDEQNLDDPACYADLGLYDLLAESARRRAEELNRVPKDERRRSWLPDYNTCLAYQSFADFMTGRLKPKSIGLYRALNMTTVMCQTASWADVRALLGQLPAKWQICVRCAQELVQGSPRDVLPVLRNPDFTKHTMSAYALWRLVNQYAQKAHRMMTLKPEEKIFYKEVPAVDVGEKVTQNFLLCPKKRNPAPLDPPFAEEMRALLERSRLETEEEESIESIPEIPEDRAKAYQAARRVSYAAERIEACRARALREEETQDRTDAERRAARTQRKQTLQRRLNEPDLSLEERMDCLGEALWLCGENEDAVACVYSVRLGLLLFEQACEKGVYGAYTARATPRAREILYEMAVCLPGLTSTIEYSDRLKVFVPRCLLSYTDLDALLSDSGRPALASLCGAITDTQMRGELMGFLRFLQEISRALRRPAVSDAARLEQYESFLRRCTAVKSTATAELRQHLAQLLKPKVFLARKVGWMDVRIYNDSAYLLQSDVSLSGAAENFGDEDMTQIRLELQIDGVPYAVYTLERLHAHAMVPFQLTYSPEVDDAFEGDELRFSYSLLYSYVNGRGEAVTGDAVSGTFRILLGRRPRCALTKYVTDRPASGADYILRESIEGEITRSYRGRPFSQMPNLAIYGMKRTGKSSALQRIRAVLEADSAGQVWCVMTSGENAAPGGGVTAGAHQMLVSQVIAGADSLDPRFHGAPGWSAFVERWLSPPPESDDFNWLTQFYYELSRDWLGERGLVVLVDEVERMYRAPAPLPEDGGARAVTSASDNLEQTNLWGVLSAITQSNSYKVRFVLCGSDHFTNTVAAGNNTTQIFQRWEHLAVGRMTRSEQEAMMRAAEPEGERDPLAGPRFLPDSLKYLWELTDGLPWHSKLIGNQIISSRLGPEGRATVYPEDVALCATAILSSSQTGKAADFGMIGLTEAERAIVDTLADALDTSRATMGDDALYRAFCARFPEGGQRAQYDHAMDMLLRQRKLIRTPDAGESWCFGSELYRLFCRRETVVEKFTRQ